MTDRDKAGAPDAVEAPQGWFGLPPADWIVQQSGTGAGREGPAALPNVRFDEAAVAPALAAAPNEGDIVAAWAAIARRGLIDAGEPPHSVHDPEMADVARYLYRIDRTELQYASQLVADTLNDICELQVINPYVEPFASEMHRGEPAIWWQIHDYIPDNDDIVRVNTLTRIWRDYNEAWKRRGEANGYYGDHALRVLLTATFRCMRPRIPKKQEREFGAQALAYKVRRGAQANRNRRGRRLETRYRAPTQMRFRFDEESPVPEMHFQVRSGGRQDGLADALALEIIQAIPREDRTGLAEVDVPGWKLIEKLFNDFRPRRDWPRLVKAIETVDDMQMIFGEHDYEKRIIGVARAPIAYEPNWRLIATVDFPAGSNRGPEIYFPDWLRELRTSDMVAWRCVWRLLHIWDKAAMAARATKRPDPNPERHIFATAPDGGPNPYTAEIPALSPRHYVHLGFNRTPIGPKLTRRGYRKRLIQTQAALSYLRAAKAPGWSEGVIDEQLAARDSEGYPTRRLVLKRPDADAPCARRALATYTGARFARSGSNAGTADNRR